MKKIIGILLAAVMLCGVFCAAADELFATYGEALAAAGEQPAVCGRMESYTVALEKDGKFLRAVAELDEEGIKMNEAIMEETDFDKIMAMREEFDEYLNALPITYTEEITAVPVSQGELDAFVGKTIDEVIEEGYDIYSSGGGGEEDEVVFVMMKGLFNYRMVLNESLEEYMTHEEDGYVGDLTVKSACFEGLNWYAADLDYLPDGTYTGQMGLSGNLDLGEAGEILNLLAEAMNSEDGKEIDPEELIEALIKLVPDKEEEIRDMMPLIMSLISGEEAGD